MDPRPKLWVRRLSSLTFTPIASGTRYVARWFAAPDAPDAPEVVPPTPGPAHVGNVHVPPAAGAPAAGGANLPAVQHAPAVMIRFAKYVKYRDLRDFIHDAGVLEIVWAFVVLGVATYFTTYQVVTGVATIGRIILSNFFQPRFEGLKQQLSSVKQGMTPPPAAVGGSDEDLLDTLAVEWQAEANDPAGYEERKGRELATATAEADKQLKAWSTVGYCAGVFQGLMVGVWGVRMMWVMSNVSASVVSRYTTVAVVVAQVAVRMFDLTYKLAAQLREEVYDGVRGRD